MCSGNVLRGSVLRGSVGDETVRDSIVGNVEGKCWEGESVREGGSVRGKCLGKVWRGTCLGVLKGECLGQEVSKRKCWGGGEECLKGEVSMGEVVVEGSICGSNSLWG